LFAGDRSDRLDNATIFVEDKNGAHALDIGPSYR
jgi:hypothetical protein